MTSDPPKKPDDGSDPTKKPDDGSTEESEGWESFAEEASGGSLEPSPELEEALREAADAVEAREASGKSEVRTAAPDEELDALRQELEQLNNRHIRLQADFENHRRRTLMERQDTLQYGHQNVVKDLLGTVDNLDRAMEHASQSDAGDFESMLQGIELVRRELLGALVKYGVSEIEAKGQIFDPKVHEALAQLEDETVPAGTVVEIIQKGYQLRDRMLRPARVVVSRQPDEGSKQAEGQPEDQPQDQPEDRQEGHAGAAGDPSDTSDEAGK